ncbi:MAG: PKD domain-containing protein [Thermoplasmata archaeon]|nr:PKD domain-containing protein [Thermoplasmata archaeon]
MPPGWYNTTRWMGHGPATQFGAIAYDPLLHGGELVYFGGRNAQGAPTNGTWEYAGGTWANASRQLAGAPPARFGASLEFAPVYSGLLLFGGIERNGTLASDTWLLVADRWENLSSVNPSVGPAPRAAFAAATWEPPLNGALLVGGCLDANCSLASSIDWLLNVTGWHPVGSTPAGRPVYGAALAYDVADTAALLFGGEDPSRGLVSNTTYELLGGSWVNLTSSAANCSLKCLYPRAGELATLTWSGRSGSLLLFGGYDPRNGTASNASWTFLHGKWTGLTGSAAPPAAAFAELPSDSSSVAPVLLEAPCSSTCPLASWSWDLPPAPRFTVFSPNPADAGVMVSLELANDPGRGSGPTASWSIDFGDHSSLSGAQGGLNFSSIWSVALPHRWPSPGSFPVVATVTDFCHVPGTATLTALVAPRLALGLRSSATSVGPGAPVTFEALPTGGVPAATFVWSFGDGLAGSGAVVSHSYSVPGNYTVGVRATDSGGGNAQASETVTVVRSLAVGLVANWSAVDAGVPVGFVGNAGGGTGSYSGFDWQFGDGANATGPRPMHVYGGSGSYTAVLTVTDSAGGTGTGSLALTVNPTLVATAVDSTSNTSSGQPIDFGDNRTGGTGPFSYSWQFGDGSSSGLEYPTHSFARAGHYHVDLWVNDSGGGFALGTLDVTVAPSNRGMMRVPLLLLGGAFVVLATLAGVLLLRRHRRRQGLRSPRKAVVDRPSARPPRARNS